MEQVEFPTKKFLLMGLDNSGKTSICLNFRKNTNLLSYLSLRPTRKVNIERFKVQEKDLSIWDFGGQKAFREEYLQNLPKYLSEVEKIIYVIDVQAIERYEESLEYLDGIITKMNEVNIRKDFTIFLHKYDPFITTKEEFKDIDTIIEKRLVSRIRELIPKNLDYNIFKTCIFTSFKKISV
ncbi:MAG: Arsenical resistance operon repressor, ArsR [Promethearchaeota archaeon]|nr:MAG: Arsenical resistance operon repressor, ArsR [Candidatus Lokiarchaeota archaeon]